MRGIVVLVLLTVVAGGCATVDALFTDSASLLSRADRFADRQQYEAAIRTYDEFLARYPNDPAGARALKSRDTIASIVTGRSELARLRSELGARDGELARLRQETERLRQETERLRGDLEKLKEVDLNLERKKR